MDADALVNDNSAGFERDYDRFHHRGTEDTEVTEDCFLLFSVPSVPSVPLW